MKPDPEPNHKIKDLLEEYDSLNILPHIYCALGSMYPNINVQAIYDVPCDKKDFIKKMKQLSDPDYQNIINYCVLLGKQFGIPEKGNNITIELGLEYNTRRLCCIKI